MVSQVTTLFMGHPWYCGVVMSGEDAARPCLENLIITTDCNKQQQQQQQQQQSYTTILLVS
jgi:hypothetical protein